MTSKEVLLRDIAKIESSTDENRKRIGSLLKRMLAREIFASSSAIREYLETIGLNSRAKKMDRYRAIKKISDYLCALPPDRARDTIQRIEQMATPQSSLQRWTDLIVSDENR